MLFSMCTGVRSCCLQTVCCTHATRLSYLFGPRLFAEGRSPSRCAFLRSSLRLRRMASACCRAFFSDGFSYALRNFISRKRPSRCSFFLSARSAWSMLLSFTKTFRRCSFHETSQHAPGSDVTCMSRAALMQFQMARRIRSVVRHLSCRFFRPSCPRHGCPAFYFAGPSVENVAGVPRR